MVKTWRICISLMVAFSCISAAVFVITGEWNGAPGALIALLLWGGILYGAIRQSPISAMLSLTFFTLGFMLMAVATFLMVNHEADGATWVYLYFATVCMFNLLGAVSSWHAWQQLRSA